MSLKISEKGTGKGPVKQVTLVAYHQEEQSQNGNPVHGLQVLGMSRMAQPT